MKRSLLVYPSSFLLSVILSLFICATSMANTAIDPQQIKYLIRDVEGDITQLTSRFSGRFSNVDALEKRVRFYLEQSLAKTGLLANENDPYVIPVDLFVDYRRRLFGDASPVPAPKLAAPNVRITQKVFSSGHALREEVSKELTTNHFARLLPSNHTAKSVEETSFDGIAVWIANSLVENRDDDIEAFLAHAKKIDDQTVLSARYALEQRTQPDQNQVTVTAGLGNKNYISDGVVNDYIKRINDPDKKIRMTAYKALTKVWINAEAIFDVLESKVLASHKSFDSETKENKDEIAWQMKSMASSGLPKYRKTLELLSESSPSSSVQKRAKSYLAYFDAQQSKADIVHDISTMSSDESWQINQLANMLNSGDAKLSSQAISIMYKNHKDNDYLLNIMAKRLEKESIRESYRSFASEGDYAWFCRILGESGKSQYKPLLEKVAEKAQSKKVRKFAKKFSS